eukprot:10898099-Ditylum_brightwellii.AAC.1
MHISKIIVESGIPIGITPGSSTKPSSNLKQGSSSKDNTIYTSYTLPKQILHHPSMSTPYHFLMMELPKSGSSSGAGYRQCLREKMSRRDPQATQLSIPFSKATQHMFSKKAEQTQKCYMRRNLQLVGGMTDFPAYNGNKIQQLNDVELFNILEYGVPASWCREFTKQGFDPVDQGFRKFVEFCTCLELCEHSADKPKDKKSPKSKFAEKRKADMPTKPTGEERFYCNMHRCNKTHNTEDCFELKQRAKHAKPDET